MKYEMSITLETSKSRIDSYVKSVYMILIKFHWKDFRIFKYFESSIAKNIYATFTWNKRSNRNINIRYIGNINLSWIVLALFGLVFQFRVPLSATVTLDKRHDMQRAPTNLMCIFQVLLDAGYTAWNDCYHDIYG